MKEYKIIHLQNSLLECIKYKPNITTELLLALPIPFGCVRFGGVDPGW